MTMMRRKIRSLGLGGSNATMGTAMGAAIVAAALALAAPGAAWAQAMNFDPDLHGVLWPNTDLTKASVSFDEVFSGGVPRDGIPPIDDPITGSIADAGDFFGATEPVITVVIEGEARAYALGVLMRHEIVNDELGGVPISVTFCPLCNSAVVFDRRVGDRVLDFGVSGLLRNSDLIMWDRQTESWWQQFLGEAIVGEMVGTQLTMLPVRVESFEKFVARYPDGTVNMGSENFGGLSDVYRRNPYVGYDQENTPPEDQNRPFLFFGDLPEDIAPLTYVLAVGKEAWTLDALREAKRVKHDGLVIIWEPGQNSVMGAGLISQGHDLGNVTVQREENGEMVDVVHDVTFAFAFNAFVPDGVIYQQAAAASAPGAAGLSPMALTGIVVVVLLVGGFVGYRKFGKRTSSA